MEFEDLLEMLINPEPEGVPDDIFDQLRGAHTGALEGRDSQLAENSEAMAGMQSQIDALNQSLVEVKAANFDKLMAAGSSSDGDPDLNNSTLDDVETEGEMSTDDFFEKD